MQRQVVRVQAQVEMQKPVAQNAASAVELPLPGAVAPEPAADEELEAMAQA